MSDAVRLIEIKEEIHADNQRVAQGLRRQLEEKKTFLLNLMSSPGAAIGPPPTPAMACRYAPSCWRGASPRPSPTPRG